MKKIRAAIVGYGNIGKYALQALESAPDFEVAGVVRRAGAENKPAELEKYPVVKEISELEDVDVAILSTPTRSVEGYAKQILEAGINTATYKAYIDFAADYGVEYVILDEGWAVKYKNDLMAVVEQIDLKEIVNYAALKGVGIILWAGYNAFNSNMEEVCRHYSAMGVKGFKIDFMDRDDTLMNLFHYRAAEICAKQKL